METSEPKRGSPILNIIGVNSLKLGGLHINFRMLESIIILWFKYNRFFIIKWKIPNNYKLIFIVCLRDLVNFCRINLIHIKMYFSFYSNWANLIVSTVIFVSLFLDKKTDRQSVIKNKLENMTSSSLFLGALRTIWDGWGNSTKNWLKKYTKLDVDPDGDHNQIIKWCLFGFYTIIFRFIP